jgi:hypothetical protein
MAKLSKGDTSRTEVHSDAWERFERAVDVVAKSPPQHRESKEKTKAAKLKKPKDRASSSKS